MGIGKKFIRKLKAGAWFPLYNCFYEHVRPDARRILLESRGGCALEGNIFRITAELSRETYTDWKKIVSVRADARGGVRQKLKEYGISGIALVRTGSLRYYFELARAGYLVNDTSFPGRFVKKEGQVYLNTWHGTPLKKMGRDNRQELHSMGNVMRNLIQSDYLLFPSRYMQERMVQAYQLRGLFLGTVLNEGYPRNSVLLDARARERMRKKLGCENMQLFVYMPTFRGSAEHIAAREQCAIVRELLGRLDTCMTDRQMMIVKLHPLLQDELPADGYRHIRAAQKQYDIYDVLAACDTLITDYSSVFYDYAVTGRRIILYAYDEEDYCAQRGLYEPLDLYPFPKVCTADALIAEMNSEERTEYPQFIRKYCTYESKDAAENICRRVFLGEKVCAESRLASDERENILIYAGDLDKNGITTALYGMLEGLDADRFHYYLAFRRSSLEKDPGRLDAVPEGFGLFPIASEMNLDLLTILAQMAYFKKGWKSRAIQKRLDEAYAREWKKHFGAVEFAHVIHYNGYERYVIALIRRFRGMKSIWVHNDMLREIEQKGNQNYYQLRDAYREYQNVVVVSPDICASTLAISGRADNIRVIGNVHNYREVLQRAKEPVRYDAATKATVSKEELIRILDSSAVKFINIGRYSPEKGHARLIRAFERYYTEHRDTYLIIIGGTGNLYEETVRLASLSAAANRIVLIYSMGNPMPVLCRCQLFVLSSFYEGLGLVMLEADTLGVPVVACDVNGPAGFLREHGGTLVEDSEEGIYHGMQLFAQNRVSPMNVDYERLNQKNIRECEKLMELRLHKKE